MSKKNPSSTTTQEVKIPSWLLDSLKPLLGESAANMLNFQRQGQEVLHGGDYRNAPQVDPMASSNRTAAVVRGGIDPEIAAGYYASRRGARTS